MPLPEDVFWAGDERGIPHRMVREGDGFREEAMAETNPQLPQAAPPKKQGKLKKLAGQAALGFGQRDGGGVLQPMTRALEIATLAIRWCVVLLLVTTALLFIQLRKSAIIVHEQVEGIGQDIHLVREHADRVLTEAGLTAKSARQISEMEAKEFPATLKRVNGVIDRADALIGNTDHSLNGEAGVLPRLARATKDDSEALQLLLSQAQSSLGEFQTSSEALLREGSVALHTIAVQAGNPDIQRTLANLEAMSESGSETMGHVNAATGDIKDAVHRATRPTALWKSLLLKGLGLGASARTVVLGR